MFVVPPLGGAYVRFTEQAKLLWRLATQLKLLKKHPLKWELRTGHVCSSPLGGVYISHIIRLNGSEKCRSITSLYIGIIKLAYFASFIPV